MSSNAGDQYQLFVGNLPHSCTDQDLKNLFMSYGPVRFSSCFFNYVVNQSFGLFFYLKF